MAARDTYTEGHAARAGELSCKITTELGLAPEEVERVRFAGLLHDIGKIGFSDLLFQPHQVQQEHAGRKWDAQCVAALGSVLRREE